jgi:uncharacterized phage protein (TIGR01671 family)
MAYRKVLYRAKLAERQTLNTLSEKNKQKYFADGWAYGFYVPERSQSIFGDVEPHASIIKTGDPKETITGMWFDVKENTVGQYIGIDDINKKPIFEDDIVKCSFGNKEYIGVIQWQPSEARYLIYNGDGDWLPLDATDDEIGLEIIGNIYDNPELLEVQ